MFRERATSTSGQPSDKGVATLQRRIQSARGVNESQSTELAFGAVRFVGTGFADEAVEGERQWFGAGPPVAVPLPEPVCCSLSDPGPDKLRVAPPSGCVVFVGFAPTDADGVCDTVLALLGGEIGTPSPKEVVERAVDEQLEVVDVVAGEAGGE
jgi:hypothetical protein